MIAFTIYTLTAVFLYKVFYNMWAKEYEQKDEGFISLAKEQQHTDAVCLSVIGAVFWFIVIPFIALRKLYKRSNLLVNLNKSLNEMADKMAEKLK